MNMGCKLDFRAGLLHLVALLGVASSGCSPGQPIATGVPSSSTSIAGGSTTAAGGSTAAAGGSTAAAGAPASPTSGAAPTISGTPGTSAAVGVAYSFQPTATSAGGGALTFAIQNLPPWATFNEATGLLSGTPGAADVSVYANIVISVSNSNASAALAAFSISVTPAIPTNGACGTSNGIGVSSVPTSGLCSVGTASAINGAGPWTWSCAGGSGGSTAQCAAPRISTALGPLSKLHYAPNGNFDAHGTYLPGADGFNLADVSNVSTLNSLPAGTLGLVWVGLCNGADAAFTAAMQPFIANPKVFGFYLMDEPDPTGQYAPLCTAANLKAESDWIHAQLPGTRTFIVMMNLGTPANPNYAGTYNPLNTDIDLFGLDPYPVRPQFSAGVDYSVISAAVSAAEAAGIPSGSIVPVYQAFGGGGFTSYTLPTPTQEQQLLSTWSAAVPGAVFDYAYSWGTQNNDQALATSPDLQTVFAQHNAAH